MRAYRSLMTVMCKAEPSCSPNLALSHRKPALEQPWELRMPMLCICHAFDFGCGAMASRFPGSAGTALAFAGRPSIAQTRPRRAGRFAVRRIRTRHASPLGYLPMRVNQTSPRTCAPAADSPRKQITTGLGWGAARRLKPTQSLTPA